jgi:hypothetical protein
VYKIEYLYYLSIKLCNRKGRARGEPVLEPVLKLFYIFQIQKWGGEGVSL